MRLTLIALAVQAVCLGARRIASQPKSLATILAEDRFAYAA